MSAEELLGRAGSVLEELEAGDDSVMGNRDILEGVFKQLDAASLKKMMSLNPTMRELGVVEENARRLADVTKILTVVTRSFQRINTCRAYNLDHEHGIDFKMDISVPVHAAGYTPTINGKISVTLADGEVFAVCDLVAAFVGEDSVTLTFTFYFITIPGLLRAFQGGRRTQRTKIAVFSTGSARRSGAIGVDVSGYSDFRSISFLPAPGTFTLTVGDISLGTYTFEGLYAATFRTSELLTAFAFCMDRRDFQKIINRYRKLEEDSDPEVVLDDKRYRKMFN